MKTKVLLASALAAASFGVAGTTVAQAAEVSANIGVSSAYVFRGSVFGDDAQVSGGVDLTHGAFYAGTWISSQGGLSAATQDDAGDFVDAANAGEEVDLYAGFGLALGSVTLDLGYIYYAFPSFESGAGNNISEIYVGTSFDLKEAGGLDTYIWFAPSGVDDVEDDEYVYFDINYSKGLTDNTSVYAHFGLYQGLGDANDDDADEGEFSTADYAIGFTIDDFFIQASYLDDYTVANDDEPQYIVGWSKEFAIK